MVDIFPQTGILREKLANRNFNAAKLVLDEPLPETAIFYLKKHKDPIYHQVAEIIRHVHM